MRIWLALLAAPILALADQSIAYAVSGWACSHQQSLATHAVHAVVLVAVIVFTALAWRERQVTAPERSPAHAAAVRHFLATLATASGALSALVVLAMWYPVWVLSACSS